MSEKEVRSTGDNSAASDEGEAGISSDVTSSDDVLVVEEDSIDDGYELSEAVEGSEYAPLARRHLDDDEAYSLEPDVVLMRAQTIAAELGVEVTVVLEAVEAHSL